MKKIMLLLILIFALASPSFSAKHKKNIDSHKLRVKPGQTFNISLKSNPSTGYMWQIQNPIDKTKLVIINKIFSPGKKNLAGSPGKEVWKFKALKKGTIFIEFAYKRSWENQIAKRETYAVAIK